MQRVSLSVLVLVVLALPAVAARQFISALDTMAGHGPVDLAAADFNGDGKLDVAVADSTSNSVQILIGTGNNTFQTGQVLAGINQPGSVVTGDFNGDGKIDVAFNNFTTCTVSIYLGNGDGTFTAAPNAAECAYTLAVGDFNGDGKLDISAASVSIDILIGHGDGTFTSQYAGFQTPSAAIASVAKDVNSDGKLDLVVSYGGIEVFLGNGNGTVQAPIMVPVPSNLGSIGFAVGDFNGDSHPDIAATLRDNGGIGSTFQIFTGIGNGHFNAGNTYSAGSNPQHITAVDLNADGILDLAVSNNATDDISVFRGNGDASFSAVGSFVVGAAPLGIVAADFNNDGKPDLMTADNAQNSVSLLPATGQTFAGARGYLAGQGAYAAASGDFNGDGNLDLVVADLDFTQGRLEVLLGDGHGHFGLPTLVHSSPGANFVAVADLNGDGKLDMVVTNSEFTDTGLDLTVFLGNGDGSFETGVNYNLGGDGAFSVAIADLNRDGKLDLAVSANGGNAMLAVLLGNGDGSFQSAQFTPVPNMNVLTVGDINGDGKLDVVAGLITFNSGNTVSTLLGNGNGTFQVPTTFGPYGEALSISLGDLNGDGKLDIVTCGFPTNLTGIEVFLNSGSGTFGAPTFYRAGGAFAQLADFDSDGKLDVLSSDQSVPTLQLRRGVGNGTFGTSEHYDGSNAGGVIATGDFNGDSALDVAEANNINRVVLWLNTSR